jgi:hypothetical protein
MSSFPLNIYGYEILPEYPALHNTPALGLDLAGGIPRQVQQNFFTIDQAVGTIIAPGGVLIVPTVTASVQAVNTTVAQGLSISAPAGVPTMYALSIYLKSIGTAGSGHTYTETITYTAADGSGTQTIALILHLDSANVVMETYPLLILQGTTLTMTGAYGGGATVDPYTISARAVSMPLA